jgi:hypothetical protein
MGFRLLLRDQLGVLPKEIEHTPPFPGAAFQTAGKSQEPPATRGVRAVLTDAPWAKGGFYAKSIIKTDLYVKALTGRFPLDA